MVRAVCERLVVVSGWRAQIRERSTDLKKQLATKETFVKCLWGNFLVLPQKLREVVGRDGDVERSDTFTGPVQEKDIGLTTMITTGGDRR